MVVAAGAINAQGGAAAANEARRRAKVAAAVERESNRSVDVTSPRAPKPRGLFRQATAKAFGNDVLPYQRQVREFYTSNIIQQIIAVIIMLNFFGNMVEKELDPPYGKRYAEQWLIIEDIFNYIFCARQPMRPHDQPDSISTSAHLPRVPRVLHAPMALTAPLLVLLPPASASGHKLLAASHFAPRPTLAPPTPPPPPVCPMCAVLELVLNLWGSWFVPFWKSGWNVFDFFVVTVGVLSLLRMIDGPLSLLRMLRAFRVFRLFKRIKSLNKIIVSLARAVPGVAQAFVIMMIFMAIYAILAVEFFAEFGIPYAKNLSAANEKELVEMIQAATKGEGADGGWVETPEYYYVTQYALPSIPPLASRSPLHTALGVSLSPPYRPWPLALPSIPPLASPHLTSPAATWQVHTILGNGRQPQHDQPRARPHRTRPAVRLRVFWLLHQGLLHHVADPHRRVMVRGCRPSDCLWVERWRNHLATSDCVSGHPPRTHAHCPAHTRASRGTWHPHRAPPSTFCRFYSRGEWSGSEQR